MRTKKLPVIIALDARWEESKIWVSRLRGKVWGFKVGSILFAEKGPRIIEKIQSADFKVFLDLKFHDIPNTVQHSVRTAFSWGVDLVTVHACGGRAMLEASASEQKKNQNILAVTVLTSLDNADLKTIGVERELKDQVIHLADLAISSGIKGLVCSPKEVGSLRTKYPSSILVTPGVRFEKNTQDQKRTETLGTTMKAGASLAVVGRALTGAENWKEAWQILSSSMDEMS